MAAEAAAQVLFQRNLETTDLGISELGNYNQAGDVDDAKRIEDGSTPLLLNPERSPICWNSGTIVLKKKKRVCPITGFVDLNAEEDLGTTIPPRRF